ncbi:MAG: thiamine pyrophosphate-binding protein [Alphaproteobacteria bacterium]|nr:thiamine pyrophosphate-binding protein [Alphaproteobacteria bacterium]
MAEKIMVGDLVAEFLQQVGVNTAFGVISVHNIPMLDGIGRRNAIRFVMARGEAGGGHMADAYARVSGNLGVLFTSTGPGAANACGALVEARFAGSSVLHITGQTATGNIDRAQGSVHDVYDQLGMLKSVSKAAYRVRSADSALGVLTQAATEALTPPTGPVSVEIPIDIQRTLIDRPPSLESLALPVPPPKPVPAAALEAMVEILAKAKRPMLWCGSGARHAGEAVKRLAEMGVGIVTSWAGRGVLSEDHPMTLGGNNGTNTPLVEKFYETVDVMVVAGSRLRGHETRDMTMPLPRRLIHIDVDPTANGRTYASELFVSADSKVALDALAERLTGRLKVEPGFPDEIKKLKAETMAAFKAGLGAYSTFPEQLRAALPRDAIFVRDITLSNSTWGHRLFPLYGPRDSVYPVGAAIGPGLHLGIGASLAAKGRKVVAMCGDGGFFLNISEIWTAVQEKADICFIVMNDKGYGVIKHIQDALYGGRHFFGDLHSPPLEKLTGISGIAFERVAKAEEFGSAVQRAVAVKGPSLVEVDMNAIGEFPRYFQPPPYAQKAKA